MKQQSIFKIRTAGGSGTAFYIADIDALVTNYHVVEGYHTVCVESCDKNSYEGKVLMISQSEDIAIVKVDADFSELPKFTLSDVATLKSRDEVFALGYPFGLPYTETKGIVSAPDQLFQGKKYIQTDAPINPGNSGGPLINILGEIVGINTSKFNEADNIGFAVPANRLKTFLEIYKKEQPASYSVICSSCECSIAEETEYCDNCGGGIDKNLFDQKGVSELAQKIEGGMLAHGINPVIARNGYEYWEFYQGSSLVRIYIYDGNFVCANSPINTLPNGNLEPLMRYILSDENLPYNLGTWDKDIFITYRTHYTDLFNEKYGQQELDRLIGLAEKADFMDNYLNESYGCDFASTAKI
ncbi:MAG TPA: trypsin-like peptidase domain-containing protein [Flavobacterium sp.]|nr:trypsin-like peptidase domain-containing protein [Flavobacterium sp.]